MFKLFPSKEKRAYNKMHRKHKKELVNQAKKTFEWDWSYLHESVIKQIKHMHEYYICGNNVMQADESKNLVINQLKHILDLNEEIEKFETTEWEPSFCTLKEWYEKEAELYKELYSYIGEHIQWWWD